MDLREKYILPYYSVSPPMDKLLELFNNKDKKLFNLVRHTVKKTILNITILIVYTAVSISLIYVVFIALTTWMPSCKYRNM